MATPAVGFCGIYSESKKIIKAHSRHFLALSVIFLLPIAFSLVAFPTLQLLIAKSDTERTEILSSYFPLHHHIGLKTLSICLLYSFAVLVFSLCATGTIIYSVYQGFFGRPVKFVPAIKSLWNSLVRLFLTVLCAQIIVFSSFVLVGLIVYVAISSIEFLGFEFSYSSSYFTIGYTIGLVCLGLGFIYLQVNWVLASVIVVVESSWGFEPLRRSAYLVRGMRGVALSLLLVFVGLSSVMVWFNSAWTVAYGNWSELTFVMETVFYSALVMMLLLHGLATNTVLYMYCKALHGELAMEIAEEFAREYVSLPFDGEKVPHIVSVIQH